MKSWREKILKYFTDPIPALTIAADPDGLLEDKQVLQVLGERGIEVVQYDDHLSFRYAYESRYRDALPRASFHLVIRVAVSSVKDLPFDILSKGKQLDVSIGKLFPKLSAAVMKNLSMSELDAIAAVYNEFTGVPSDTQTMSFLLKALYHIDIDQVYSPSKVMELLLVLVLSSGGQQVPQMIADYLDQHLRITSGCFRIPVKEILTSEEAFLQYFQEQWTNFIVSMKNRPQYLQEMPEGLTAIETEYPIASKHVRPFLDDLFASGKLRPVAVDSKNHLPEWIGLGVEYDAIGEQRVRLLEQIFRLSESLNENMKHNEWLQAAEVFGEIKEKIIALSNDKDSELNANFAQLQRQIDRLFSEWVLTEYNNLHNLPYAPYPIMVHHIPHYLAYKNHGRKMALIVLDGMSIVEWRQIRRVLKQTFQLDERFVYAWIPTITSVSRQAIFTGERPAAYAASINTTVKEAKQWQSFWQSQGLLGMYVDYIKIADYPLTYEPYSTVKPTNKVKAIVVDLIDQLVHRALQGNCGLYEEVKIWLNTGFVQEMLSSLLGEGYEVYITSDHGNRECTGAGKIMEGVLAHTRGERVRVYNSKALRDKAAASYYGVPWDSLSLPPDMHTLLAPVESAFVTEGDKIISHGSMSIEEVIVPFIKVMTKGRNEYC